MFLMSQKLYWWTSIDWCKGICRAKKTKKTEFIGSHGSLWEEAKSIGGGGGGLGFRDLEHFNLVMLAKQCWRLIQNPHTLAAQVLTKKYYPKGNFLQATLGIKPSFIWRTFMATKPLLEERLFLESWEWKNYKNLVR